METNKELIITSNPKGSSRKESFDTLKTFLAFFVVVIHTGFSGWVGLGANAISRTAVPLFFMITGYYLSTMTDEKFRKTMDKIIFLSIVSTLFYFLVFYIVSSSSKEYFHWLIHTFDTKRIIFLLFFNQTPIGFHLWYFYALLYVLIIINIARKYKKVEFLYKIVPVLLIGNYILSYFDPIAHRNFLFTGLPYVLLGGILRNNENQLTNMFCKSQTLVLGLIIVCIGLGVEMFIYNFMGTIVKREHFLFTLPIVLCVFLLALKHPHWGANSILTKIGKEYSAYIYIMHVFVMSLIQYGLKFVLGENLYYEVIKNSLFKNSYPFLVFGITLIVVFIIKKSWSLLVKQKRLYRRV